ncbi:MAG: efflux RND transporter permease subunit, partial [Bullifex sp.]
YPGASAETVEREVIDILEEDFVTLPNFSTMTSNAYNSMGVVQVEFSNGVEATDQLNEIRNRIRQLSDDLPDGLEGEPMVMVGGMSLLPIMTFTVETGEDLAGATNYIKDEVIPLISQIDGVSTVTVSGGIEEKVVIKLNTDELLKRNISTLQVYQMLSYSNLNIPLGTGEYQNKNTDISFEGAYDSLDDIRNITVGASDDGTLIKLRDVASVELTAPEPDVITKKDGKNIISVEVCKREDGNTMKITSEIKKIIEKQEADSNGALKFNVISDDSRTIKASLTSVVSSGISGVLIAVIVIFLCLGDPKATGTIALSMPLAILFTFIGMKAMNISISLMSLAGIVIALGSIVDGSIVMLEQTYMYYRQKKDGKYLYTVNTSIYRASDTVAVSILGSALTTIIVFIPILMIEGLVGQILRDVSLSFIFALGFSAIVAIVVMPYLLKKFLPEKRIERKENIIERGMEKLNRIYGRMINWTLHNRKFIITICITVLLLTVWAVAQLGVAFIPSTDNSEFYINFTFPSSNTMERTEAQLDKAEAVVRELVPEIKTVVTTVGSSSGLSFGSSSDAGSIRVILQPVAERDRNVHEIMREVKYALDECMTDTEVNVLNGGFDNLVSYVTGGGGYAMTLVSEDMDLLYSEASRIADYLKTDPEVMSVEMNTSFDNYSAIIKASNDYLSSLGVTSYEAGMTTAILFNGIDNGTYIDSATNERYDIRLESDVTDKMLTDDLLSSLAVITQDGRTISFGSVADLEIENSISQINHIDRANTITINCATTDVNTKDIVSRLDEYLAENPLDPDVTERVAGVSKLVGEMMGPIFTALAIAVFLVFMIMVFQFERFDQPLLIIMTVPFCIIGVVLSLLAFNSTLNMISLLGVISLAGTAVNNGIILIDYMNMLVDEKRKKALTEQGYDIEDDAFEAKGKLGYETDLHNLQESIVEGAQSRLRSILMTTLTTMLGVVPMAVGTGEGSEIYAPLGQAIAGGLLATTAIALFLMPVLYYILERRKLKTTYRKQKKEAEVITYETV